MIRTLALLAFVLVACAPVASRPDAAPGDAPTPDAGIAIPFCVGEVGALRVTCPDGYTPVCGHGPMWQLASIPGGGTSCQVAYAMGSPSCRDLAPGDVPTCRDGIEQCLPPSARLRCPEVFWP